MFNNKKLIFLGGGEDNKYSHYIYITIRYPNPFSSVNVDSVIIWNVEIAKNSYSINHNIDTINQMKRPVIEMLDGLIINEWSMLKLFIPPPLAFYLFFYCNTHKRAQRHKEKAYKKKSFESSNWFTNMKTAKEQRHEFEFFESEEIPLI